MANMSRDAEDILGWLLILFILFLAGLCGYYIFSSPVEREPYSQAGSGVYLEGPV